MAAGVSSMLKSEISPEVLEAIYVVTSSGVTSSTSANVLPVPSAQTALSPAAEGCKWSSPAAPGYVFWKLPVPSFTAISSKNQSPVVCASDARFPPQAITFTPALRSRVADVAKAVPSSFASTVCEPAAAVRSTLISIRYHVLRDRTLEAEPMAPSSSFRVSVPSLTRLIQTIGVVWLSLSFRIMMRLAALGRVATFRYTRT